MSPRDPRSPILVVTCQKKFAYSQRFICRELLGELYRYIILVLKFIIFQEEGQLVNANVEKLGSFFLAMEDTINQLEC